MRSIELPRDIDRLPNTPVSNDSVARYQGKIFRIPGSNWLFSESVVQLALLVQHTSKVLFLLSPCSLASNSDSTPHCFNSSL